MPKKPAPVEKHNPWIEVDPESIRLYTLPEGVTKNCEHYDERENMASDYRHIFIGTNNGIYFAHASIRQHAGADSAKQVGLEGKNIVKLEQRNEKIIAYAEDGKAYGASNYALKGMR